MAHDTHTPPSGGPAGDGCTLIAQERQRQISVEGWTPEHDDEHARAELAEAGLDYAWAAVHQQKFGRLGALSSTPPTGWPWDRKWWNPSPDPIRNLVKAGALIAAEIDRLQRAVAHAPEGAGANSEVAL